MDEFLQDSMALIFINQPLYNDNTRVQIITQSSLSFSRKRLFLFLVRNIENIIF